MDHFNTLLKSVHRIYQSIEKYLLRISNRIPDPTPISSTFICLRYILYISYSTSSKLFFVSSKFLKIKRSEERNIENILLLASCKIFHLAHGSCKRHSTVPRYSAFCFYAASLTFHNEHLQGLFRVGNEGFRCFCKTAHFFNHRERIGCKMSFDI